MSFNRDSTRIDAALESARVVSELQHLVRKELRRQGAVVGISGGVDSAVVLALLVQAFGPNRVVAVMMPDKDSNPISETLARELSARFGVEPLREDITPALEGFRCYERRDEAIRRLVPAYEPAAGYKAKIVLPPGLLEQDVLNVFHLVIVRPDGTEISCQLSAADLLAIVAASNFKQRARMATLYFHAEARNYAVIGTANKNEHDQGFFVKFGDSGADVQAIGHLYKTQVYQLAKHLQIPESICQRTPTTDTYSAPCSQEEFFFRLPFATMDLLMHAREHAVPVADVAAATGLTEAQVQRAVNDFSRKERATRPLRLAPLFLAPLASGPAQNLSDEPPRQGASRPVST